METLNITYQHYNKATAEPVIVLPTCKGIMVIPVQQIIRIQSISNYSKLFFNNACPATGRGKTLVVAKVLRWFEERLSPLSTAWRGAGGEGFIRIHRTHLVNINYIKTYQGSKTGLLLLSNGEIFSVAKRKKAGLAGRLNNLNNSLADASAYTSSFITKKFWQHEKNFLPVHDMFFDIVGTNSKCRHRHYQPWLKVSCCFRKFRLYR